MRLFGAAVALLSVMGFTAPGCVVSQDSAAGGAQPVLQFVGDSITVQASDVINARFADTYRVGIDAVSGITTTGQTDAVAREAARAPDVEVIDLGTNDARCATLICSGPPPEANTPSLVDARLDAFAREFPASTCVVVTTINSHNPSWGPGNAAQINTHIRATFAHVADWDAAWSPGYFPTRDDPHPDAAGRRALVGVWAKAIAGCPSGIAPVVPRPHPRAF